MKKIITFICLIAGILALFACTQDNDAGNASGSTPAGEITINPTGELEVIVFSTKKTSAADAILIRTENYNIMIDTSTNKGFKEVKTYFEDHTITTVHCLIVTHFDNDHVGGGDQLFDIAEVKQVIMPKYGKKSKQFEQFTDAMNEHGLIPTILTEYCNLTFDDAIFSLYPPEKDYYGEDKENDFSIITSLIHGNNKFLFMGDAESERTREYLYQQDIAHQFIKAPYHGRYKEEYGALYRRVNPDFAIITSADKEPADISTLALLESLGVNVYRTSDGTVLAISDGSTIKITQPENNL